MLRGVSPDGSHLYPAFPYPSYARMKPADVADLYAFMKTLPAVDGQGAGSQARLSLQHPARPRPVEAALSQRRAGDRACRRRARKRRCSAAIWSRGPAIAANATRRAISPAASKKDEWLAGAVAAEGDGIVPNITSGEGGIGDWSEGDIAYYLETGFTPDFDSVGGAMVDVQKNMAQLQPDDRAAIAAYLKAVPPHPNGYPAQAKPPPGGVSVSPAKGYDRPRNSKPSSKNTL